MFWAQIIWSLWPILHTCMSACSCTLRFLDSVSSSCNSVLSRVASSILYMKDFMKSVSSTPSHSDTQKNSKSDFLMHWNMVFNYLSISLLYYLLKPSHFRRYFIKSLFLKCDEGRNRCTSKKGEFVDSF